MATLHWLLNHAAALAFAGGLLEFRTLLVLGGWAAQHGDVPLGELLLFAFQGCVLGEPLLLSFGRRRLHISVVVGLRCARHLGLTWWLLRPTVRPWSLAILNLFGGFVLSVAWAAVGYELSAAWSVSRVELSDGEAAWACGLVLVEVLIRLWRTYQRRHGRDAG